MGPFASKEQLDEINRAYERRKVILKSIKGAEIEVSFALHEYALTISDEYRQDFFDPRNRDYWVKGFCEWLMEKQRKSAEVRASND